ncbi:hypothetical protein EAO73_35075 [Streptomyces sp. col6]|uniref:endonuclease domain-containing protein n=1 Tax=Streptomyces sp. col6 TaxID=2478958 RepID=UPI0011CEBD4A|nr:endonuclease domain-containing protein [Streptomyces sp. col6]TXR94505.1 hypothetical protein EAO73_35075 [Streptomyces sp. col6]
MTPSTSFVNGQGLLSPGLPAGWPCTQGHLPRANFGPELARRDSAQTGLYHLWNPQTGANTIACHHLGCDPSEEELGPPTAAVLVPRDQRCRTWLWPLYIPRPLVGPLPHQWAGEQIPRWYVWWRLYELQDGRCATCDCSPAAVDHDHTDGAVRGLLCVSCNSLEGAYARGQRECAHEHACFSAYWDAPPAKALGWIQVGRTYRRRLCDVAS